MKTAKKLIALVFVLLFFPIAVSGLFRPSDEFSDASVAIDPSEPPEKVPEAPYAETRVKDPVMEVDTSGIDELPAPVTEEAEQIDFYEEDPLCAADKNASNFGRLLTDLVAVYEDPRPEREQAITEDLEAIKAVSRKDHAIAALIVSNWSEVYLNKDYPLYIYEGGTTAPELASAGISDSSRHAIVVLGYKLKNGQMQDELKGRCDAAAAFARSFPSSIIVCSGGATGDGNPKRNTEAGLMKKYLVEEHGIDASRIYIDERAENTKQNAEYTLQLLFKNDIETMTIVTSVYHQRRSQVVYNAEALLFRALYGYTLTITGNYSFDIPPSAEQNPRDYRLAVNQVANILGLPNSIIQTLPSLDTSAKSFAETG